MEQVVAHVEWQWVCPNFELEETQENTGGYPINHTCDNCETEYEVAG